MPLETRCRGYIKSETDKCYFVALQPEFHTGVYVPKSQIVRCTKLRSVPQTIIFWLPDWLIEKDKQLAEYIDE